MEHIPSQAISFLAMAILFFTVIRSRKRVRCLEQSLADSKMSMSAIRSNAEKDYNENEMVKLADYCRELEARVQNRALLLEELIEQADEKINQMSGRKKINSPSTHSTNPLFKQIQQLRREGKNDRDVARILNRTEGEIQLLRSLGNQSS
ncbi:MAG: hypothetical protein HQL32_13655 [Planctomycetes bacterium]|nr:hypothetical protein [Planctomycetota bacterium]